MNIREDASRVRRRGGSGIRTRGAQLKTLPYTKSMWRILAVFLLVALSQAPANAEERVILAFGNSLTAGLGVSAEDTYPALLQSRLRAEGYDYRVVNAGVSGDTTAGGLRRVEWALRSKPEIVILELGVNDALRGQDLAVARRNLAEIVERFQEAGARVLVLGMRLPPNYGVRYSAEFERMFETVARNRRAALMPFFLDGVGGNLRLNQADGIHPTAEGYRIVVERLWPHLRRLLSR